MTNILIIVFVIIAIFIVLCGFHYIDDMDKQDNNNGKTCINCDHFKTIQDFNGNFINVCDKKNVSKSINEAIVSPDQYCDI